MVYNEGYCTTRLRHDFRGIYVNSIVLHYQHEYLTDIRDQNIANNTSRINQKVCVYSIAATVNSVEMLL